METNEDFERRALELMADALDVASDARADWVRVKAGGDTALATRVLTLLDADTEGSVQIRTGGAKDAMADTPPPERVGAYRIVELIGRGGMGAVYLGERDTGDFEHRVAIKLIKPGILSEALVERFTRERQTLASLNHPHIARLFDGGALNDGTPYIVMEYIEGRGIVDHAKSRGLDARERFALFRTACEAVRHAHQNLVIHRDITPSNVLVTTEGEVKLIDFGIAKPNEDGAPLDKGPGSLDSLTFTPGFAAPERSKGAGANTLSDVYSLGKLLEALLEPAMMDDDASAIIARATEADPLERYPSVDALIDDLDAYAEDRPLEARGGGAGYVFGKFLKRRKFIVAGLTAAFAAITLAFVNAQTQFRRAEARFEQARGLATDLLADVYFEFTKIPGTLKPRERFAEILTDYTDALAADPYAPADVKFDVGRMYGMLAEVYGGIGVASLEDYDRAQELLTEAETALDELMASGGQDSRVLAERARIARIRGGFEVYLNGDTEAALASLATSIALAERAIASDPEDLGAFETLWNSRLDRLYHLGWAARQDEIIDISPGLLEELERGIDKLPKRQPWRYDILRRWGEAHFDKEENETALPILRDGIAAFEDWESSLDAPIDYNHQVKLLSGLNMLAQLEYMLEDEAALPTAQRLLGVAEAIRDADPDDVNGVTYVITANEALAKALALFGEPDEAIRIAQEAVAGRRNLLARFPDNRTHKSYLAFTLSSLGSVARRVDDRETACAAYTESLSVFRELAAADLLTEYERDIAMPTVEKQAGVQCSAN